MIKSHDKKFLFGILALIFLLTTALSEVASSQENQAGKQNILRQASLEWMQVGMEQYQSDHFTDAEQSFRRALVFQKYLTAAEREQINKFLAKARIAVSEGKQAVAGTHPADESVEQDQTAKAVEKVKDSQSSTEKVLDKTSDQPSRQKVKSVVVAESGVSKIQVEAGSSQDVILVTNKSFSSRLMRLSAWLSQNRRKFLTIGLPALAVLVFISKLQGRRKRPGRRVYENYVPANSSYIGSRLNGSKENNRPGEGLGNGSSAFAAAGSTKRKSFSQSTEHWKKEPAGLTPVAGKSFITSGKWPQRKDKYEAGDSVIAKAGQKLCRKCNELKAQSDFHKDKSCKDGLARWCKECKAKAAREYRRKQVKSKK